MPNSYTYFKPEIRQWFIDNVPTSKRILDVGPGQGTYSDLLRDLGYRMDAVEVWAPYVDQFGLRSKYDNVYVADIREFNISDYDFIILGDVLEHLSTQDAQKLIDNIYFSDIQCLVAIPYMMAQDGEEYGNSYETHLQPDLTPEVMLSRYSCLRKLYDNQWYGYYITEDSRWEKAYVLYATKSYKDTVQACVNSIRAFSDLPILVYMLNSDVEIDGAVTIEWNCDVKDIAQDKYIKRANSDIYRILIQRPAVVKDALRYAKTVAYIDSDSVATRYVDTIFNYFPEKSTHPYFVEGIYDWMILNGWGGADSRDNLTTTLEYPACQLFGVDQSVRDKYRQTGYFVAGQWCESFLDEWMWMCNHPSILQNPQYYASYHEETIANVLLWKYKYLDGLPYIYVNGSLDAVNNLKFNGIKQHLSHFVAIPAHENELLFYHGEKDAVTMYRMIERQKKTLRVLFLAPHLSTGGMPSFLLKRIQALQKHTSVDICVVEYANHSDHYVVQKNQIKKLVNKFYTLGENKMELIDIIKNNRIDVIHIEEMIEDGWNNWPEELREAIYDVNRTWRVVETCHNVVFKPDEEKRFHPDAYAFCTPYHLKTFANMPSPKYVIEHPIEEKSSTNTIFEGGPNVLNVGLWTPGKNQGEAVELAKQMPDVQFHFVGNQAGNFQHYWEPIMKDLPPNVHIWGERDDVGTFMGDADLFLFNSTFECNPLVIREAIGYGLPIIARNLPQYGDMFTKYIVDLNPKKLKEQVYEQLSNPKTYDIPQNEELEFALSHLALYQKVVNDPPQPNERVTITHYFVLEPFLEIKGRSKSRFKVEYYDEKGVCRYSNTIGVQNWIRLNRRWYTKWTIKIWKDGELYYQYTLDYTGQRVYIAFDSKSLGDNIAWMPYVLEFKKKHNCHVIVSTYKNFLFKDAYPELEFVDPGTNVGNIVGMYSIGWFYNPDKEPALCNTIPLQKAASNILGLDYQEIKPRISYQIGNNLYGKYITIATNSTAGCKFWQKEEWQLVINFLHENGYQVVNVSKEKNPFDHCIQIEDTSMENTMNVIHHSHLFIGLSSGLSWLAWAMNKKVVMISNFTAADHEFDCIRITNENVCHGCWNKPEHRFDPGDWNWCPEHKGTDRQWECQKSISASQVVFALLSHI
ncbi:MAG: autotransporter strand-loop-strand O-heptosyltransferase [Cytophagia bacterium]|nr:autotransporter strand-loop-strand O-heptosyltransferase [Cytophagia bacterium]